MKVEKIASLLVDGFLKALLRDGIGWHVTDSSSSNVVLGK